MKQFLGVVSIFLILSRIMILIQVIERAEAEVKIMTIRGTRAPLQKLLTLISALYSRKVRFQEKKGIFHW